MFSTTTIRRAGTAIAIAIALTATSTASFAGMRDKGSAEQRAACTPDVMRLCMSSVYSVDAILACMQSKKDKLSSRCRTALNWD